MSEEIKITGRAGMVGVSTLASRVLGLVRDIAMSTFFGTGIVAEAFYVAFMIPNLFRRLVGEGSLTVAFISVFSKLRQDEGEDVARKFMEAFWTLMMVVLAGMVVLGMVFSREIVTLFTNPKFRANTEQFELAVVMTRYMFPYLFLIGLVALSMGILNSYKRFFAPAFHPALLNIAWIASVLLLHHRFERMGLELVIGVLAGGLLQLMLQVPFLWRVGMRFIPRFNFKHPAVRRIGMLMVPSALAIGVVQINVIIANYFITAFQGARSQFFYANRFEEFPYAIFSIAIATAVLPTLSEQAGEKDRQGLSDTLGFGLRMVAFIIIPSSIGLALIGRPLIHVVLEHGVFTAADTDHTAKMLVMFCLGMWAVSGLRIVAQAYYAVEDMVTPLWSAAIGMVINVLGCWYLSGVLGRVGIPLSIMIAAVVNFLILSAMLKRKAVSLDYRPVTRTALKALIASLPMAAVVYAVAGMSLWEHPGRLLIKIVLLGLVVSGGALAYALAARLLKAQELNVVVDAFMKRLKGSR
jgi:putative peptidoglycan lipid II flippase